MDTPRRVHISHIEHYEDGSSIQVDYDDDPLPANDPYVRRRLRAVGDASRSEVITEFAAAPNRPPTYPADMPFLANREVWSTESPNGSMSPGTRWRCDDPDVVIAEIIASSRDDGWSLAPNASVAGTILPGAVAVLTRGSESRVLAKFEAEDARVVQLLIV